MKRFNIQIYFITFFLFINNVKSQSVDEMPCNCIDYKDTVYYAPRLVPNQNFFGSSSDFIKQGKYIIKQVTVATPNLYRLQIGASCFYLNMAPCREDGVFSKIKSDLYYNKIKTKILYSYSSIKSCAISYDSSFLSQLNQNKEKIYYNQNTSASFLVHSDLLKWENKNEIYIYNQEPFCHSNYLFTKNDVILQIDKFEIDLSKKLNLEGIIRQYQLNETINKARVKSLVPKTKIKCFTGVYSDNATLTFPIVVNRFKKYYDFSIKEILIGNYFLSAVLVMNVANNNSSIIISDDGGFVETIENFQKMLFDLYNIKSGNLFYNNETNQILLDIYYEQK